MVVQAFTFSTFHGKSPDAGSTNIRVNQLMKYWPEFTKYRYGDFPDCLIFQKVYITEDYLYPQHFENLKILDICDPDWLEGSAVVKTCHAMDAVVTPTESLAEFIRQFHNKVVVIPDRFDVDILPEPRKHTGTAKTVVWFGYSHNIETLKPAIAKIESLGLNLIVISNDDPIANRWDTRNKEDFYTFVRYDDITIYQELQKADFAILPDGNRPVDVFKSNNKTIKANLAGLPVAKTAEDVDLYMDGGKRQKWFDTNYGKIKEEYDVRKSVKQYKDLIEELSHDTSRG